MLAEHNEIVDHQESIAYLGISFYELVSEYGEEEAHLLYSEKGRAAFLPVNSLKLFLEYLRPDLLVTTVSPRAEQASILASRQLGIPSVCINDFINKNSACRIAKTKPNVTCVVSKGVADQIHQLDESLDVRVTGNPAFDRLKGLYFDKACLYKKYGIVEGQIVILWAAQREHEIHPFTGKIGNPNLPRLVEKELYQIINNGKFKLIFRSHPNDLVSYKIYPEVIDGSDQSLDELLFLCDAVITISSTVGYEGLLLGKKLFTIEGAAIGDDGPYNEVGLSVPVFDISNMNQIIKNTFCMGDDATTVSVFAESGTENVFEVIVELLSS